MNIAAGETGRDDALWETPVNPQNLVHRFTAVLPSVKEEKKNFADFFFLQALQYPQFFGSAACSARFLPFCCFDSFLSLRKSGVWI